MCGILAQFGVNRVSLSDFNSALEFQKYRGPDNRTITEFSESLLGHARLSIHDLSDVANQPMIYGDCALLFNGEIYNFRALRTELEGKYYFKTDSDTEVLLYLIIEYGIKEALEKIDGMFAFSFYDSLKGKVYIVRDRMGEKPLFYRFHDKSLLVSSNIFSLLRLTNDLSLSSQGVSDMLHYGYGKGNETVIEGTFRLSPGHYIEYDVTNGALSQEKSFFSRLVTKSSNDSELEDKLTTSVQNCLDSDVPVGCFISGGIDSSLITSLVSKAKGDITTYTIGFTNSEYDESRYAKEICDYLGVKNKTLYLSDEDILGLLNESLSCFDEPFADASLIATYALCKFARKDVTVCLSGDGGDELFVGYNRHLLLESLYCKLGIVPYFIRNIVSSIYFTKLIRKSVLSIAGKFKVSSKYKFVAFEEKLDKLFLQLSFKSKSDLLFKTLCGEDYSRKLKLPKPFKHEIEDLDPRSLALLDMSTYIHEDVLTKVDRTSMACSMEVRSPLLSKSVIDKSLSLENSVLFDNGEGKIILKGMLNSYLPLELLERPKSGFSVPINKLVSSIKTNGYIELKEKLVKNERFQSRIISPIMEVFENSDNVSLCWKIYCFLHWYNRALDIVSSK